MTEEPRHKLLGTRMSDLIRFTPSELSDDIGVGLSNIIADGRYGFGLEGPPLVGFVRKCLYELVKYGGRPHHWGSPERPDRDFDLHYGNDTEDEIVEGVIADWLRGGGGDLEWFDFRFMLPKEKRREHKRLWMQKYG